MEDDDEMSGEVEKGLEERGKAVKETNKQEEREAALRSTQMTNAAAAAAHGSGVATLRSSSSSHTVDVKNNVEKGPTCLTPFFLCGGYDSISIRRPFDRLSLAA